MILLELISLPIGFALILCLLWAAARLYDILTRLLFLIGRSIYDITH